MDLKRELGLFDSTMMMMGIVIGSGIYLTTGVMAESLPSPPLVLLAWAAGGLVILAGALTYAELGAALPEAGGQYVYLREAYGPLWGFLFGWKLFLVNMTGSIAALGVAFAEYFSYFFPIFSTRNAILTKSFSLFGLNIDYSLSGGQILAVSAILLFSFFNYVGVAIGKRIQNGLTLIKIATILILGVLGLTAGRGHPPDWAWNPAGLRFGEIVAGFGLALIAISWAFDGWNNINYIAGEIKNPRRNLPRALIVGTLGITALYLLLNFVYFRVLSIQEMSGVVRIAEKATTKLWGGGASRLLSAAVIISVLGALNGAIFAGARVYYAMAKDGLFFKKVGRIHPNFGTPSLALVLQAVWACLLTLAGTFERLFTFAMFAGILFWIAAAAAVFTLRKRRPELPRPYRTWGYPAVPMIFILALSGILINSLIQKPVESLTGLALVGLGIPVYYYWRKKA